MKDIIKIVLVLVGCLLAGLLLRVVIGLGIGLIGLIAEAPVFISGNKPDESTILPIFNFFWEWESTPKIIISSFISSAIFLVLYWIGRAIGTDDSHSNSSYRSTNWSEQTSATESSSSSSFAELYEKELWDLYKRNFKFYDSKGYYRSYGEKFYDSKGYLSDWSSFYDAKGHLASGDSFYDYKGYLTSLEDGFYDSKGYWVRGHKKSIYFRD